jgi:hypothetical protein
MKYVHVVNGDHAAEVLRAVLAEADRGEAVVSLRDDLAVGPLQAIDEQTELRSNFWHRVLGQAGRDIDAELRAQMALFRGLAAGELEVAMWHGQSSGDQLTLRRLAFQLRNTPQRLNEVNLSLAELGSPPESTPSDSAAPFGPSSASQPMPQAAAVAMYSPAALHARLTTVAPISLLRIGRLALEWQELKQISSDLRRWRGNTFISGTFSELDTLLTENARREWQPLPQLITTVMRANQGFFATDQVVRWRCLDLISAGRLERRSGLQQGTQVAEVRLH